jgi:hypothetical protein
MSQRRQSQLLFGKQSSSKTPTIDLEVELQDTSTNSTPTTPSAASDAFVPIPKKLNKKNQRNS